MITVPCSLNESNMASTLRFLMQMLQSDAPMVLLKTGFGGSIASREALPQTAAQPGPCLTRGIWIAGDMKC